MEDLTVIINCPKCNSKIRLPVRETIFRFKCRTCEEIFHSSKGLIITPENNSEKEQENKNKESEIEKEAEEDTPLIHNKPKLEIRNQSVNWKIACFFFLISTLVLSYLVLKPYYERRSQNRLTDKFLEDIRDTRRTNFDTLKSYLDNDSKAFFEMFIENTYARNDENSILMLRHFVSSIQPLDYQVTRKFMYISEDNDTGFFNVDYIKNNDDYLVKIHTDDFAR